MKKYTDIHSYDHAAFREGLRLLLEGTAIDVIGGTERLLKRWQNRALGTRSTGAPALTPRQTEVLKMIAEGQSTGGMARLLSLSVKTIEKHRQSLMNKLDIHEIATLTRYAVSSGFVEMKPYAQLTGHAHWKTRHSIRPGSTSSRGGNGRDANKLLAGAITSAGERAGGYPLRAQETTMD